LRRVDVVGENSDDCDVFTTEQSNNIVVLLPLGVVIREQTVKRAVNMDMACVIGEEKRKEKDDDENRPRSTNDQPVQRFHTPLPSAVTYVVTMYKRRKYAVANIAEKNHL